MPGSPHPRNFQADTELPPYARTGKDYQHYEFGYERGHMARHEDLSGFPAPGDARRGTREGCLMSNIVPQQRKGHVVWGKLEGRRDYLRVLNVVEANREIVPVIVAKKLQRHRVEFLLTRGVVLRRVHHCRD